MNEAVYVHLLLVLNFAVLLNRMPCSLSLSPYLIFLLIYFDFMLIVYLALGGSIFRM